VSRLPSAVFLDRDGTIMEDAHYIRSPDQVRLLPGAAAAIKRVNDAKIPVVVVTNQSGIARGIFTVEDYEKVHARFERLLNDQGARIDASYYCPHAPDDPPVCNCRKPQTLMFEQAIAELKLDAANAAYIGDRWRDIAASKKLGGRGIMIASAETTADDRRRAQADGFETAADLADAIGKLFDGLTPGKRKS
jgi:histidinol-phosphate phosphatase family protein